MEIRAMTQPVTLAAQRKRCSSQMERAATPTRMAHSAQVLSEWMSVFMEKNSLDCIFSIVSYFAGACR